jgi:hypothetical protein
MQIVEKRDAETLLPIILAHTRPGTTIHSDQWAAYRDHQRCLPTVAVHRTVDYNRHFVDHATGTHTQSIESYWCQVKAKLKCMRGTTDEMLEATWMSSCGEKGTAEGSIGGLIRR